MEAIKCAEAEGDEAAFNYQLRVRQALFAESQCVSLRHVLIALAEDVGLNVTRFAEMFDSGRFRRMVIRESDEGWEELRVQGSPTLVLADRSCHPYPGIPTLHFDSQHHVTKLDPPDCPTGNCLDTLRAILDQALR